MGLHRNAGQSQVCLKKEKLPYLPSLEMIFSALDLWWTRQYSFWALAFMDQTGNLANIPLSLK
jgi:hypothetical protein